MDEWGLRREGRPREMQRKRQRKRQRQRDTEKQRERETDRERGRGRARGKGKGERKTTEEPPKGTSQWKVARGSCFKETILPGASWLPGATTALASALPHPGPRAGSLAASSWYLLPEAPSPTQPPGFPLWGLRPCLTSELGKAGLESANPCTPGCFLPDGSHPELGARAFWVPRGTGSVSQCVGAETQDSAPPLGGGRGGELQR